MAKYRTNAVASFLGVVLINPLLKIIWLLTFSVLHVFYVYQPIRRGWKFLRESGKGGKDDPKQYQKTIKAFVEVRQKAQKVPSHVGLILEDGEEDIEHLARICSWLWVSGVKCFSIQGSRVVVDKFMKFFSELFRFELRRSGANFEKIDDDGKNANFSEKIPKLVIFQDGKGNRKELDPEMFGTGEDLHFLVFDGSFGSEVIVKAHQTTCKGDEKVTTAFLDDVINEEMSWGDTNKGEKEKDPELVLSFGEVVLRTRGYLPWHLRLSEIHHLPPLNETGFTEILNSLWTYDHCEQRIGK